MVNTSSFFKRHLLPYAFVCLSLFGMAQSPEEAPLDYNPYLFSPIDHHHKADTGHPMASLPGITWQNRANYRIKHRLMKYRTAFPVKVTLIYQ